MRRNLTFDGKPVTIERGHRLFSQGVGRPKSDLRLILEAMNAGESVLIPAPSTQVANIGLYNVGRTIGKKFKYRSEGEFTRVFCVEVKRSGFNIAA